MLRIVVGLDGSPRAPGVLAAAAALAREKGGKLVLFRSVGLPPDVPEDFWKTTEEPLLDVLKRRAREYLATSTQSISPEIVDDRVVAVAVPWEAICDEASRVSAEFIVIGSHGYSGLDKVLGTTAAKVVNHAPCSVLVVRPSVVTGRR